MAPQRDPLAPFDDAILGAIAAERGVDEAALRGWVRRHQESVRELPGVEELVYEWRRAFPRSPLVERGTEAYYLLVPPHVWPEFGDALSLSGAELDAVRAVHDWQLRAACPGAAADEDREPMVLARA